MCYLHTVHISGIDLNLAVVLRSLLEERSVSRAARQLGLSQSATSHALGRLRAILKDPLFVRTRTGLVPTARATSMADAVRSSINALEATFFAPARFDPAGIERTFRLRPSDYVESLLVPRLLERFAEVAPKMDFFAQALATDPLLALEAGELDLLIQPRNNGDDTEALHSEELWKDYFVGIARRGHPLTRGRMTLARFASAKHVLIAPRGKSGGGKVDELLEQRGLRRRISFATPSFLAAPHIVAATDLVMVVPARIASLLQGQLPLAVFEPPLEVPGFQISMFWHDRHDSDPVHAFVRREIAQLVAALPTLDSLTRRRARRAPRRR
jgi:DNA-binding transcriptional LysR family regulator